MSEQHTTEAEVDFLAEHSPKDLLEIALNNISTPCSNAGLTFVLEKLGGAIEVPSGERLDAICMFLDPSNPAIVREGAILGLAALGSEAAYTRLGELLETEPDTALKEMITEILEEND